MRDRQQGVEDGGRFGELPGLTKPESSPQKWHDGFRRFSGTVEVWGLVYNIPVWASNWANWIQGVSFICTFESPEVWQTQFVTLTERTGCGGSCRNWSTTLGKVRLVSDNKSGRPPVCPSFVQFVPVWSSVVLHWEPGGVRGWWRSFTVEPSGSNQTRYGSDNQRLKDRDSGSGELTLKDRTLRHSAL